MSTFNDNVTINQALDCGGFCNSNMIGIIEMFNSTNVPDNYIICDGTEITTSDNSEYESLIKILANSNSASSAYLPNFTDDVYPLGWSNNLSNYTEDGTKNLVGNSALDINYFPQHKHTIDGNMTITPQNDNNTISLTFNDTTYGSYSTVNTSDDECGKGNHNIVGEHTHSPSIKSSTSMNYNVSANYEVKVPYNASTLDSNLNETIKYLPKSRRLIFAIRYK